MEVHREIGTSLLERGSHHALYQALQDAGLKVESDVPYTVSYKGRVVGEYFADPVVENTIALELKSVKELGAVHPAQLLNYLRIARIELGFLAKFQNSSLEWKRVIAGQG